MTEEAGLGHLPLNDGMKALALRYELDMEHRRSDAMTHVGALGVFGDKKTSTDELFPHLFRVEEPVDKDAERESLGQQQQLTTLMKLGGQGAW